MPDLAFSDLLAPAALIISLISAAVSVSVFVRDRAKVRATSTLTYNPDTGQPERVRVHIVNIGRRPVVLRHLWGRYTEGIISGYSLDGARLDEGGFLDRAFTRHDGEMVTQDPTGGDYHELVELFIEDSAGRHHVVENSREHIRKLWEANRTKSRAG